jgi:hypothetical protein
MRFVVRHLRTLAVIAFVAAWGLRLAVTGVLWADHEAHYAPSTPAVEAVATPSHLLDRHACWTDRAPADMRGRLPGHVVVSTRSGRTVYGGTRLVGMALDQQFAHKPAGLTVWGFCR